jgi:hypothetical protein
VIGAAALLGAALIANWQQIFPRDAGRNGGRELPQPDNLSVERDVVTDVRGEWRDRFGYLYVFKQNGSDFSYRQYKGLQQVGNGSGAVTGNILTYDFELGIYVGTCRTELNANRLSGECRGQNTQTGDAAVFPVSATR